MEGKVYKVRIDKTNKFFVVLLGLSILLLSAISGIFISNILHMNDILSEILIILFLVVYSLISVKIFPNMFCEQQIVAEFKEDFVVMKTQKSQRIIYYKDIIEVQKIMVIDRLYEEKGYYRVCVKTRGRNFVLHSTDEEYSRHLDFEQVELSEVYYEFKRRGVKCC